MHSDFLGLVNGCQGIVKKICYLPESDMHINLLSVVFVERNRYLGLFPVGIFMPFFIPFPPPFFSFPSIFSGFFSLFRVIA
jgi:hypothetical protein